MIEENSNDVIWTCILDLSPAMLILSIDRLVNGRCRVGQVFTQEELHSEQQIWRFHSSPWPLSLALLGGHRAKPERNEIIQQLKSPSHEATTIPKANDSSIVVSREYKASYLGQVYNKRFMWSYPPQGQFNSIFDVFLSSKCNTDKPTKVIFGSKFNVWNKRKT